MDDLGFEGEVAIVTGAGGGLGRSHALELARRGARIVVNDLGGSVDGSGSSAGAADLVVKEIEALGGEAVANTDTVVTPEGGAAIVASAIDAFGRVDIVVNNAGILRDKAFHNLAAEQIDPVIAVHLRGAFSVTGAAWPYFRSQKYGRVVSTTSSSGLLGNFGQSVYGAAKTGLIGLTRVLALEGAKYGIKVNAISPIAYTRMTAELMPDAEQKLKPELVSPLVAYLTHRDCPVSGEIFSAGGGVISRVFIGLTQGYVNPELTAEDLRDHFDQVRDETGYIVPAHNSDEISKIFEQLS